MSRTRASPATGASPGMSASVSGNLAPVEEPANNISLSRDSAASPVPAAAATNPSSSVLQKLANTSPAIGNILNRHKSNPQLFDPLTANGRTSPANAQMTTSMISSTPAGNSRA